MTAQARLVAGRPTGATAPAASRPHEHRSAPRTLPPEFAALAASGFPPSLLAAALAEADRADVPPFDALMAIAGLSEDDLVARLAHSLHVDVAAPEDFAGQPIDADACAMAFRTGAIAGVGPDGKLRLVIRAQGPRLARLATAARRGSGRRLRVAIAGPQAFADLVIARTGQALAERATEGPSAITPELTVAHGMPRIGAAARLSLLAAILALTVSCFLFDGPAMALVTVSGVLFAALNSFRLWLACTPPTDGRRARAIADADLPVYTVMVALCREAAVAPGLLDALERLDYPAAKLDIKILVEDNDGETIGALARRPPRAGIEVLKLPQGGPKTKPRALNAGLLAARGSYLVVFDAEDRPDPDQLRIAVDAFRRGPSKLACVQARLAIDNLSDGWLCRQFAIEYAALFDVVLPALSAQGLPIALGGTSNHFRTAVLRTIGGWDPANVTEDADLGLRLARCGWRTNTINSTTWEEAPTELMAWIKQRTRWMKGFMVTAIVHGRSMRSLALRLDAFSFVSSQMLISGVAATALAYPVVAALLIWHGLDGSVLAPSDGVLDAGFVGLQVMNLIVGFSAGLACGWMGVDRRGPAKLALDLITMPFYWLLVGYAAWRALKQLALGETTHWEKTAHGVSTTRATPPQV